MKENGLLFAPSFLMRVKSRFGFSPPVESGSMVSSGIKWFLYMEEYMTIELETKISISREV
jgi:hypothetical protein